MAEAYWWRGRLYRAEEAPPLAIPVRLAEVEVTKWACPRCGAKASWDPEPRCPSCGSRCRPYTRIEALPELPGALEALERMLGRVCGSVKFRGAAALGLGALPLFAWIPFDLELPDGSLLVGAYAGRARFLRKGSLSIPAERFIELPGNLCLVVWRSGLLLCFAFECSDARKVLELLQRA